MIKVLMIARATLYKVTGGDTVQITQTAKELINFGIAVQIKLTNEVIDYSQYNLLHFFNIIRPADILYHIRKSKKPFVISPILVDYSEFDKYHRKGLSGMLFHFLSPDTIEYIKTIGRWMLGKDALMSLSYLWTGHRKAVRKILKEASLILPNSYLENERLVKRYKYKKQFIVIPNGIDTATFSFEETIQKDHRMIICVARIEGIKNQLNLIKALNNTDHKLFIIGSPAPNQLSYYKRCKQIAGPNITFMEHMPQQELKTYYQKAMVHAMPSWFETTGLSSLEAAALRCNIVIGAKTDASEYFGNEAFYCDPSSPGSIYSAIEKSLMQKRDDVLQRKIYCNYTWQQAALQTRKAYEQVMQKL